MEPDIYKKVYGKIEHTESKKVKVKQSHYRLDRP